MNPVNNSPSTAKNEITIDYNELNDNLLQLDRAKSPEANAANHIAKHSDQSVIPKPQSSEQALGASYQQLVDTLLELENNDDLLKRSNPLTQHAEQKRPASTIDNDQKPAAKKANNKPDENPLNVDSFLLRAAMYMGYDEQLSKIAAKKNPPLTPATAHLFSQQPAQINRTTSEKSLNNLQPDNQDMDKKPAPK